MTVQKFPRIPPATPERKTLRSLERAAPKRKLPALADLEEEKPTLGRKQAGLAVPPRKPDPEDPSPELPRLGVGGLTRRAPGLVAPPVKPHLEQPPPEPPRLGGGSPKVNEPARLVRPQTKSKTK